MPPKGYASGLFPPPDPVWREVYQYADEPDKKTTTETPDPRSRGAGGVMKPHAAQREIL
jgi:hypothetical protein